MYLRARTIDPQQFINPMMPTQLWGQPTHFYWKTLWETDQITGYVVQEVYTVLNYATCRGVALRPTWSRYFEAWQITGRNTFQPNGFDFWTIQLGSGRGTWTKTGVAHWVDALDRQAHFRPGGAREANILLSTHTQPTNLGPPLLRRSVSGEWDGCGSSYWDCSHRAATPGGPGRAGLPDAGAP
jgi:hypothetical protein